METSTASKGMFARTALAALFAFAIALVCAPAQAHATLTAGDISSAIALDDYAPSFYQCYSPAAGKLIATAKIDSDASFYEFQVAADANFTKSVTTKLLTSQTLNQSGLKAGKKAFVRFRTYGDKWRGSSSSAWMSKWSATKSLTVCAKPKAKKSKMTGKWKLVSSSVASSLVKYNNKRGGKFILTLKKSGKGTMRDYDRSKKSLASWGATGKKTGIVAFNSYWASRIGDYATVKVKGKKLTFKTNTGVKMTFKKM